MENQSGQQPHEKTIVLNEISNEEAGALMSSAPEAIKDISKSVPRFKKVDGYTTFKAEYAMVHAASSDDLVIHFFETPEHPFTDDPNHTWYWLTYFPNCLDEVGRSYFQATRPRLVAKFTEELKSWFFRARGYDHILDIDEYVGRFFEKLDKALEETQWRERRSE